MKKYIYICPIIMISSALYNQQGLAADFVSRCKLNISGYDHSLVQDNTNNFPVTISSDYAKGDYPNSIIFNGNVDINQGDSHLHADKVQLQKRQIEGTNNPISTVDVLGNVCYSDNNIILKGNRGWRNLNNKDTNIYKGDYQIVGHQGHGKADLIKRCNGNRYTIFKNSSFTSCSPKSNTWSIVSSKIIHDNKKQIAEFWNSYFKIGSVKIFYSPYFKIPIGNKRHSGFLTPNIKYRPSNYLEIYLPYYWNIAPNIDATITPHYMYKRGNIMWENEFRYLNSIGTGLIEFDYLPSKTYENEYVTERANHRWLFYWQHAGILNQTWYFNIDYNKVSDPSYFNDFDSKYGLSTDNYIAQIFSAQYSVQDFNTTISTKQFQILNLQSINNYSVKPQLDINWYHNNLGPFDLHLYCQAVHFVNTNPDMPESTRLHLEQDIYLPLYNSWASINTEAKFMATRYFQKNLDKYNKQNGTHLEYSVNRFLPQFKINGKVNLERNIKENYIQTLEPHIQYLYIPYFDQSKIHNYDSSFLQSDYNGLFRYGIYGGFDRIASAHQVKTGFVTRVYDKKKVERFNISVGQIYYLSASRTGDNNINWEQSDKTGSLIWASDTHWQITDCWRFHGNLQYDNHLDDITTCGGVIEYNRDENHLIRLNYRYANSDYINIVPNYTNNDYHKNDISQIGAVINWSVANRWSLLSAYYYDTNKNKLVDQISGLQYNSYCYAIRFSYEHKINGWNTENNQSKHDNIIGFNIELNGLSSNYGLKSQRTLYTNILPYRSFF